MSYKLKSLVAHCEATMGSDLYEDIVNTRILRIPSYGVMMAVLIDGVSPRKERPILRAGLTLLEPSSRKRQRHGAIRRSEGARPGKSPGGNPRFSGKLDLT
jgi:hypothetical protein